MNLGAIERETTRWHHSPKSAAPPAVGHRRRGCRSVVVLELAWEIAAGVQDPPDVDADFVRHVEDHVGKPFQTPRPQLGDADFVARFDVRIHAPADQRGPARPARTRDVPDPRRRDFWSRLRAGPRPVHDHRTIHHNVTRYGCVVTGQVQRSVQFEGLWHWSWHRCGTQELAQRPACRPQTSSNRK